MISKTSSSHEISTYNIQAETVKRRIWILAVTALFEFCYYVLGTILELAYNRQTYRRWYSSSTMTLHEHMTQAAMSWLGPNSATLVITIPIAIAMAYAAYFWLYKPQAVDFYMGQPVTRRRQYVNTFINSVVSYAALTLVFTILALLIAAVMKAVSPAVIGYAFINFLRGLLLFVAVYNTAALAVLISRNYLIAVIVTGIFLLADPIINLIKSGLMSSYYATYYSLNYLLPAREISHPHLFSPITNHVIGMQIFRYNAEKSVNAFAGIWKFDLVTLLFVLVTGICCGLAYEYRKAEDIGNGLVRPWIKNVLKFIVAIPMALTAAIGIDSIFERTYSGISVLSVMLLIFMAALVCVITEMICAGSMKAGLKGFWHIAVVSVCAFLIFAIFKNDITGYDRYVPKAADIESYALFKEYGAHDRFDDNGGYINEAEYYAEHMFLTDVDAVTGIAPSALEAQRQMCISSNLALDSDDPEMHTYEGGNDAVILYRLKNGRYAARRILIPKDTDESLMNRILGTDEYRKCVYDLETASKRVEKVGGGSHMEYSVGFGTASDFASPDIFAEFAKCYENDLKKYDYTLAAHEFPVGTVRFYSDSMYGEGYFEYTYEVFECYTDTLAFLRSHDLFLDAKPEASDIRSMSIFYTTYEEGTQRSLYDSEVTIDDADRIAALLPLIRGTSFYEWNLSDRCASITLYVDQKELAGKYGGAEIYEDCAYIILDEDVPQDIRDMMADNITYDYSLDYSASSTIAM